MDGKNTGAFGSWQEASDFLITHARWLLGSTDPDQAFLTVERDGQDAVVTLELDPKRPRKPGVESPDLIVSQPGEEIVEGDYQINKRWSVSVARDQLGGALEVGKEHCHLLALAFQSGARC